MHMPAYLQDTSQCVPLLAASDECVLRDSKRLLTSSTEQTGALSTVLSLTEVNTSTSIR